ncbi:MAG: hypothetical protein J2O39_01535 [Acidimicrobiales bacterium]|nr:hypothetical protein [Acidimicrobiales bacterium]MBO0887389.1 hypothetical protein [Acidimicrobiales bacterium]MBO0893032.1 hypothetical protein [Acidimicrobiales bacterium]
MRWWNRQAETAMGSWFRRAEPPEEDLASECEAFLAGRFAGLLDRRGEPLPAWAWLNPLAHATRAEIEALAARAGPPHRLGQRLCDWREAVATVAADLLRLAPDDQSLRSIQLAVLLPVELALMGDKARLAGTPEELLRTTRAALFGSPHLALGGPDA